MNRVDLSSQDIKSAKNTLKKKRGFSEICSCLPYENLITWYDKSGNWHYSMITDLI